MTPPVDRRSVLRGAAAIAGAALLDACASSTTRAPAHAPTSVPPSTGDAPGSTALGNSTATTPTSPTGASQTTGASVVDPPTSTDGLTTTAAPSAVSGGPATYVAHGPATTQQVALTFHMAGEPALATALLDVLAASGVHVTLLAVGDWLTAHPALGQRAVADGHELGNHTKSHQQMKQLSAAQVRREIVGGADALVPFIGSIGRWFRPSGTEVPSQLILDQAGRAGYRISLGYDIDSLDYTDPGAAAVVENVRNALHPGAIISLHVGHRGTIDALPTILAQLATTGLAPVTAGVLLG